jgi:integrase
MRNTSKPTVDLSAAVRLADHHEARALTLEELVRAYDAKVCAGESQRLKKWVAAFGHISAWEISSEQLSAAAQMMLDAGYKPATPNRDLSTLGTIYRWAAARRLCPRGFKSPTLGVRRFKEDVRRIYVSDAEVEALRRLSLAYKDRRFGVFVALILDSGARRGEVVQRCWSEVNLERREILLPTSKNGTPRTLHFSDQTLKLLLRVFPNPPQEGLIFEGRVPGQPINYRAAWRRLINEVGLPDLHLHDSRHIVAAGMLRNGISVAVAAQALGNSPAVLAARYGHLETKTLREAVSSQWNQL